MVCKVKMLCITGIRVASFSLLSGCSECSRMTILGHFICYIMRAPYARLTNYSASASSRSLAGGQHKFHGCGVDAQALCSFNPAGCQLYIACRLQMVLKLQHPSQMQWDDGAAAVARATTAFQKAACKVSGWVHGGCLHVQ